MLIKMTQKEASELGFEFSEALGFTKGIILTHIPCNNSTIRVPDIIGDLPVVAIDTKALKLFNAKNLVLPLFVKYLEPQTFNSSIIKKVFLSPFTLKETLIDLRLEKVNTVVSAGGFPQCSVLAQKGFKFEEAEFEVDNKMAEEFNNPTVHDVLLDVEQDGRIFKVPAVILMELNYGLINYANVAEEYKLPSKSLEDYEVRDLVDVAINKFASKVSKLAYNSTSFINNLNKIKLQGIKVSIANSEHNIAIKKLNSLFCTITNMEVTNTNSVVVPQIVDNYVVIGLEENAIKYTAVEEDVFTIHLPYGVLVADNAVVTNNRELLKVVIKAKPLTLSIKNNSSKRQVGKVEVLTNSASIMETDGIRLNVDGELFVAEKEVRALFESIADEEDIKNIKQLPLSIRNSIAPLPALIKSMTGADYISIRELLSNGEKGLKSQVKLYNYTERKLVAAHSIFKSHLTQIVMAIVTGALNKILMEYKYDLSVNDSVLSDLRGYIVNPIFSFDTSDLIYLNRNANMNNFLFKVEDNSQLVVDNSIHYVPAVVNGNVVQEVVLGSSAISGVGVVHIPEGVIKLSYRGGSLLNQSNSISILDLPATVVDIEEGAFVNMEIGEASVPEHILVEKDKYFNERTEVKLSSRPTLLDLSRATNIDVMDYNNYVTLGKMMLLSYELVNLRKHSNLLVELLKA